jgi:hypothetical protein
MTAVAAEPGIGTAEALRELDPGRRGARPGVTAEESAEMKRLEREAAELRRKVWLQLNLEGIQWSVHGGAADARPRPGGASPASPGGPRRGSSHTIRVVL